MKIMSKTINDITVKDAVKVYVIFQSLFLTKRVFVALTDGVSTAAAKKIGTRLGKKIGDIFDKAVYDEDSSEEVLDVEDLIEVDDSQEIQPL
jgi:hypothetical protein